MWLLSPSEAKLESQPAPILRCHCTTLWSLTFEECKSHGVRASASCTASALGVFVRHTFAANKRCHSRGIRGPGAGFCLQVVPLGWNRDHTRNSVIHPHKICTRTTGSTNRVLDWFYLTQQFRDEIKLQTTWQAWRSWAASQYYAALWNH